MHLVALVVLPVVAMMVLGIQRIDTERRAADAATEMVDAVELRAAVAAVLPSAQLERTALVGLARIDEIGIPRQLVVGLTGVDFESIYNENVVELDRAVTELVDGHAGVVLAGGVTLGERWSAIDAELSVQRDLSSSGRANVADVDRVFDALDLVLGAALTAEPTDGASIALERQQSRLDSLSNVVLSAGELNRVLIGEIVQAAPDRAAIARAEATHEAHVQTFRATLDADERRALDRVDDTRRSAADELELGDESTDLINDPDQIRDAADNLLAQFAYLDALTDYSDDFLGNTAAAVNSEAESARNEATRTTFLIWMIAGLTLVLIVLVLWSILTPLRRLTRRADTVSSGHLDSDPLPLRGPRDIQRLTATMNDMAAALGRVNDRISRLAAGEVDDAEDGDVPGTIGVSLRNSVRHLASVTSQLHRSEALSSAIIDQADDSIWTIDDDGAILSANDASCRLTGLPIDAQVGRNIDDLLSQTSGEAVVLTSDRSEVNVLVARSVIDAGDDRVIAVIAHDISERSRFEERLAYQAMHDALTGLPNRFALLEYVETLSREHEGDIAVLYLDLDGFKSVNDVQGHAVGDRVLAEIAAKLAGSVRDGEFVGRLGGDEFVVVTHRFGSVDDVMVLAERLVREVELPHEDGGQFFSLSVSVGVAVPPQGTDALDMIGQADNAVYQAKRQGRGRVVLFDSEMQRKLDDETELELALRQAVINDELVMHLQPVFDLVTGRITGGEALVRWNRPGHGLVPPGDFIPVAERSDLILELERWVLTQACRRIVAWRERQPGCGLRIAVNISGRHLSDGDLVADVQAILHETTADPAMLEIELTETHLLEDMERATQALDRLRGLGVTIAVDDFGTGYSSMTYLRELPVDVLKIDRTFVARATEHGYDSTVIEAVLAIARILDLSVVAEGVETNEQLDFVRSRGCDAAQGFLMARPMPIDDAESVIFATADQADHGEGSSSSGRRRPDDLRATERPTRSRRS